MRFSRVKQLEIIGEACNHVDSSVKDTFPEVEWRKITGLRHILVHEYFGIDPALVWDVTTDDMPKLKSLLIRIVRTL
ncbi:HepT-like ribonuclease domain-containing protein [Spirosoma radiotolerans]|uniref:HepT-like ribonuclease domain-containing protein n=1 Tax=Spirosoma radiotolerans TaxID=1379870 RepID=UPI00373FDD64